MSFVSQTDRRVTQIKAERPFSSIFDGLLLHPTVSFDPAYLLCDAVFCKVDPERPHNLKYAVVLNPEISLHAAEDMIRRL